MNGKNCAYCEWDGPVTKDHVFPKCLYPSSKSASKVQRVTVPACSLCNKSFSDDEAHFCTMLLMAGEKPNEAVRELWRTRVRRSFKERDARKRARDLLGQIQMVETEEDERRGVVFPGKDERVMRVVRKVIRGLCHYHQIMSPVLDEQVWADDLGGRELPDFLNEMEHHHCEEDIAKYAYSVLELDEPPIHSVWIITFFERVTFIGMVSTLAVNPYKKA